MGIFVNEPRNWSEPNESFKVLLLNPNALLQTCSRRLNLPPLRCGHAGMPKVKLGHFCGASPCLGRVIRLICRRINDFETSTKLIAGCEAGDPKEIEDIQDATPRMSTKKEAQTL